MPLSRDNFLTSWKGLLGGQQEWVTRFGVELPFSEAERRISTQLGRAN